MSRKSDMPFRVTRVTNLGDDLYKISRLFPQLLFSVLFVGICSLLAIISIFFIEIEWLFIELLVLSWSIFSLLGIFLIYLFVKMYRPLMKIPDNIQPIRIKTKLEMFPLSTDNVILELFDRFKDIFYIKRYKEKKILNREIKIKGSSYRYDIFYKADNFILFYFLFIFIVTITVNMLVDAIKYYDIEPLHQLLFAFFILISLIDTYLLITKFFLKERTIIVKYIKGKVEISDVKLLIGDFEKIVKKKRKPMLIVILSNKDFPDSSISFIQRRKGMVHGKYPITLIQNEGKSFKLIWTD